MARRSEHSFEELRDMVLTAAETIVIEEGYSALTVRKVAMQIGYTVGTIYMVFANMNDLIMHIKGRTLDELASELQNELAGVVPVQQMQVIAKVYLSFAHEHYHRWRMIFDVLSDEPVPEWYQQKVDHLLRIVEQACAVGLPEQSQEQLHLAARALWSGVHGVCVLSLNGSLGRAGVKNVQATVDMLVEHFMRGWSRTAIPAVVTPPKMLP
jgi:AcrR family transcriptional regulator